MSGPVVSHRNPDEPQPEACALCGHIVPASSLAPADVEGLNGAMVCNVNPGCAKLRSAPSFKDTNRGSPGPTATVGSGRVYPPGAPVLWTVLGD